MYLFRWAARPVTNRGGSRVATWRSVTQERLASSTARKPCCKMRRIWICFLSSSNFLKQGSCTLGTDKKTINDSNNGLILFALPVWGDDRGLRCDSLFDPSEGNPPPPCGQWIFWGGKGLAKTLDDSVMHVLGGESVNTLDILENGSAGQKVGSILRKATQAPGLVYSRGWGQWGAYFPESWKRWRICLWLDMEKACNGIFEGA